jgi:TatD DNase family protein
MELIDTHCHLTFAELAGDIEGVIARSKAAGVIGWITVGTDVEQIKKVLALVSGYDNMYAAVGIHPHYAKDASLEDISFLKTTAKGEKVVAIGETGLDYHYTYSEVEAQKKIFRAQLEIAAELALPVIVHSRNAFDDTIQILDEFSGKLKNVVIHCYSGTAEQAEVTLEKGYYISFTGIVTFKKKNEEAIEAAKLVPLDRMMVETDCPFISPEPVRNRRPCEPAFMVHIARKLAELKGMDLVDFASKVTTTSKQFFNLPFA